MLNVKNLKVEFYDHSKPEVAVRDVDFSMEEGEIVGLVGESGSGKSLTATAIAGLIRRGDVQISGEVLWEKSKNCFGINEGTKSKGNVKTEDGTEGAGNEEIDLLKASRKVMRSLQGKEIGFIFQDPMTAFSPVHKIGYQVEDALRVHEKEISKEELKKKALEALAAADLPDPERVYNSYPFELSGGMRQRAMIASAMISSPRLLIADEPTTALDVTVQAEIIKLLKRINEEDHTAILFISHDLGLVRKLCSKVIVLKNGDVVESGSAEEIFQNPRGEYTKKLIAANVVLDGKVFECGTEKRELSERDSLAEEAKVDGNFVEDSKTGGKFAEEMKPDGDYSEETNTDENSSEKANAKGKYAGEIKAEDSFYDAPVLCEVRDFSFFYPVKKNFAGKNASSVPTERIGISNINLVVHEGEVVGLVGESGSGKSTLAKCIVGLQGTKKNTNAIGMTGIHGGSINRGKAGMVFQDSYSALNPKKKVGWLLKESLRLSGIRDKEEQKKRVAEILKEVELSEEFLDRFPAQLSGGQRQRIMIAMALLQNPTLLVADEPVSALDVAIQESITKLLKKLSVERNMAILFISHDLRTVYTLCDKVCVMQKGRIVEEAPKEELYTNPKEEYTKLLLRSALE